MPTANAVVLKDRLEISIASAPVFMKKHSIVGYHLGEKLDLKTIKHSLAFECIYADPTELIYQNEDESFFQIFDYGSIVFLGVDNSIKTEIINNIRNILELDTQELCTENFAIEIDPEAPYKVMFNRIRVPKLNLDLAKVLMINMAQSVALDNYIEQSNSLLGQTELFSAELEAKGKLSIKGKKLLKYIGRTLNLRNRIAQNLYIFDNPDLVWNDEFLNRVNDDLNRELDIRLRHRNLQENLNIVKENLEMLKDIYQHSHSSFLEWIIIILIAIEILNLIVEKSM